MQNFPHHYAVSANSNSEGNVELTSPGLVALESAAPTEFDGPGDRWSPETLLVASVADCFILSFKAIARMSKFDWLSLRVDTVGTLDRVDRVNRFTEFQLNVELVCPQGTDHDKAMHLLEKAESICLITNSLTADTHLDAKVSFDS